MINSNKQPQPTKMDVIDLCNDDDDVETNCDSWGDHRIVKNDDHPISHNDNNDDDEFAQHVNNHNHRMMFSNNQAYNNNDDHAENDTKRHKSFHGTVLEKELTGEAAVETTTTAKKTTDKKNDCVLTCLQPSNNNNNNINDHHQKNTNADDARNLQKTIIVNPYQNHNKERISSNQITNHDDDVFTIPYRSSIDQSVSSTTSIATSALPESSAYLIYIGGDDHHADDDCIVTDRIMPLISIIDERNHHIITMMGPTADMTREKPVLHGRDTNHPSSHVMRSDTITSSKSPHSTLQHIQQKERWSCGYRNTQMMLTHLIPLLSNDHMYFQRNIHCNNCYAIPSLYSIQNTIEQYWKDGYDMKGRQHYQSIMCHTTSKIGAVEVCYYLSYCGIDATIVQFQYNRNQHHITNGTLIGSFCQEYFQQRNYNNDNTNNNKQTILSSYELSHQIVDRIKRYQSHHNTMMTSLSSSTNHATSMISVAPLYLQWDGHSVTVIGVELSSSSSSSYNCIVQNLLIFDPCKHGNTIQKNLSSYTSSYDGKPQQQQTTNNNKNNKLLDIIRLPIGRVNRKHCQLIACTTKSLTYHDQQYIRQNGIRAVIV